MPEQRCYRYEVGTGDTNRSFKIIHIKNGKNIEHWEKAGGETKNALPRKFSCLICRLQSIGLGLRLKITYQKHGLEFHGRRIEKHLLPDRIAVLLKNIVIRI